MITQWSGVLGYPIDKATDCNPMFDTWCVGIGFAAFIITWILSPFWIILGVYKVCFFFVNGHRIYCINSAIGSLAVWKC